MATTIRTPQPRLLCALESHQWLVIKAIAIILVTLVTLYFRRPDQFHSPYIWVEEGTISLQQYLAHGWRYLGEPVMGYLIVPSKLVQMTALELSAPNYPALAMALTVLAHCGVLFAIAFSPTSLRAPFLCALFPLFLPTDSEVFGTSHYLFWWTSLLLAPPLLWAKTADCVLVPRLAMVALGGLSSPLVVAFIPLFLLRTLVARTWRDATVSTLACACAAAQVYCMRTTGTTGTRLPDHVSVAAVVRKFFGNFVFWTPSASNDAIYLALGIGLLLVSAGVAYYARRQLRWRHLILFSAMLVSIAISCCRAPVESIDPISAGARYFFYPFIFLGWLLVELAMLVPTRVSLLLWLPFLVGLHQFAAFGPRGHHPVDWVAQLETCARNGGYYQFPFHFAGNADDMWHIDMAPTDCRRLLATGLFK